MIMAAPRPEIEALAIAAQPVNLDAAVMQSGGNGQHSASDGTANDQFALTDTGLAERFAQQHGNRVRYCATWGKWLVWDDRRFCPDDIGAVDQLAKQTARSILREAADESDDAQRKYLVEFARKAESAQRRTAMLQLAHSEPPIPIRPESLDQDNWLLNCLNGTIDLRTGELREHRQSDAITKLCQVDYLRDATAPTWLDFLRRIFDCNEGLIGCRTRIWRGPFSRISGGGGCGGGGSGRAVWRVADCGE